MSEFRLVDHIGGQEHEDIQKVLDYPGSEKKIEICHWSRREGGKTRVKKLILLKQWYMSEGPYLLVFTGDQELVDESVLNYPVKPPPKTQEEDGFSSLVWGEGEGEATLVSYILLDVPILINIEIFSATTTPRGRGI